MPTLAQWRLIVVLGIVHATFIPALFFRALRWASAQLSSILGYIEPLSAVALAAVFLGEIPEAKALLGGVLILFAGFLAVREELGRETAVVESDAVR
jgi:drug/metabolite transporter (DMT)-like permease